MCMKPDEPAKDIRRVTAPRARLVQLLASLAYGNDLEEAWSLVRECMNLTEQEQRDVVEQLGLKNTKDTDDGEQQMNTISVPQAVLDGIMAIRDSGLANMLDRPTVVRLAFEMDHPATATWIDSHPREYAEGVIYGFKTQDDTPHSEPRQNT